MKVLYTSTDLYRAISGILADPDPKDRRVVLVAYVGKNAKAFLPDPKALEIVCSLSPGSTSSWALSRLRDKQARLFKSNKLHMKVYWSNRKGCVICSANASSSALGMRGLKEAGAWFPPGAVDIDRLWEYAHPLPIKDKDLENLIFANGCDQGKGHPNGNEEIPGFLEWSRKRFGRKWRLSRSVGGVSIARPAVEKAKKLYNENDPYYWIDFPKNSVERSEWILVSDFSGDDVTSVDWFHAYPVDTYTH